MPKRKPIPDPVEELVELALRQAGITFERKPGGLDFYLPTFQTYIECKQFYTARVLKQLAGTRNVILIQGMPAARAFAAMINGLVSHERKAS